MRDAVPMILFPLLMIIAGTGDVLTRRIPNMLVLLTLAAFLPVALIDGMSWGMLGMHALVAFGMLAVGVALYGFGLFGAGDAKLLAAAGLWLGLPALPPFLMITAYAGAAAALWTALRVILPALRPAGSQAPRLQALRKVDMPYGYAIAMGAIFAFPHSSWFA